MKKKKKIGHFLKILNETTFQGKIKEHLRKNSTCNKQGSKMTRLGKFVIEI